MDGEQNDIKRIKFGTKIVKFGVHWMIWEKSWLDMNCVTSCGNIRERKREEASTHGLIPYS